MKMRTLTLLDLKLTPIVHELPNKNLNHKKIERKVVMMQ